MEEITKGFTIDQIKKAMGLGWENLTEEQRDELLTMAEELEVPYDTVEEMAEYGSTGGYAYAKAQLISKRNLGKLEFTSKAEIRARIEEAIRTGDTSIPDYMKEEHLRGEGYWNEE